MERQLGTNGGATVRTIQLAGALVSKAGGELVPLGDATQPRAWDKGTWRDCPGSEEPMSAWVHGTGPVPGSQGACHGYGGAQRVALARFRKARPLGAPAGSGEKEHCITAPRPGPAGHSGYFKQHLLGPAMQCWKGPAWTPPLPDPERTHSLEGANDTGQA